MSKPRPTGQCPLCLETAELCESHIIPELCYRPAYDQDGRCLAIHKGKHLPQKVQHGYRQYLLCKACEERVHDWETYFSNVWFNWSLRPERFDGEIAEVRGLDYEIFTLFHLSVLWRASVSTLPAFSQVDLGPRHAEALRQCLLKSDMDIAIHYPITAAFLRWAETGLPNDGLIMPGCADVIDGIRAYVFVFGGRGWFYYAASHKNPRVESIRFKDDGVLLGWVEDWDKFPAYKKFLNRQAKQFRAEGYEP